MADTLGERARQNALEHADGDKGYRLTLEVGEEWDVGGRWRGDVTEEGEYGEQRLFLLWDGDGHACYIRGYANLVAKVDAVSPAPGDRVALYRGDDYTTQGGTGYTYGIAAEASDAPLPGSSSSSEDDGFV